MSNAKPNNGMPLVFSLYEELLASEHNAVACALTHLAGSKVVGDTLVIIYPAGSFFAEQLKGARAVMEEELLRATKGSMRRMLVIQE